MKARDWIFSIGFLTSLAFAARGPGAIPPGHVEGWGDNFFGQAGGPNGLDGVIAIAAGSSHSLALRTDGTVVGWGANNGGQSTVPPGLSDVVAIAARSHSVALKRNGTVVVWGYDHPAVTNVPATATQVMAMAAGNLAGNSYTVVLRSNGTVIAWGLSELGTNVPAGLTGVIGIAAGNHHVLALRNDGTVVGWGENNVGQATPPPGLNDVVAVRAGQSTSFALKSNGTVIEWGGSDMPAGLTGIVDVQLGAQHGLALQSNGNVIAWGVNSPEFEVGQGTTPSGLTDVSAISAGGNFNLVLTARPIISSISSSLMTNVGATVTFSVTASGGPLRYQWQRNGSDLPGATNTLLTITNVRPSDAGNYRVLVRNAYGSVFSQLISLSFPPPVIITHPQSQTLFRGENAAFQVIADGLAPLSYQWRKNGTNLPGANALTLEQWSVQAGDAGVYQVVVGDAVGGSITSSVAHLTIIDPTVPVSLVLTPLADTSIHSSRGNPQGVVTILAGTRNNGVVDRGLLKFALSPIPPGAVVDSAQLRLQVLRVPRSLANSDFNLHRMKTPWANDANWINASAGSPWALPGGSPDVDYVGTASSTQFISDEGTYEFAGSELVADLEMWRASPGANHGWLLRSASELVEGTARHFGASEYPLPPTLEIVYSTPVTAPRMMNVHLQETYLAFSFTGFPGWIYRVQYSVSLDDGNWTTITNIPAGGATNTIPVVVPREAIKGFYRLIAE